MRKLGSFTLWILCKVTKRLSLFCSLTLEQSWDFAPLLGDCLVPPQSVAISVSKVFAALLSASFQLPARLNGSELIAFRELAPSDLIELEVESPVWSARHLLTERVTRPELPQVSCHREDYSLSKLTLCCPFLPSCYLWEGKKAAGDGADYYEFLFALLCSQTTNVFISCSCPSCFFWSCMINDESIEIL